MTQRRWLRACLLCAAGVPLCMLCLGRLWAVLCDHVPGAALAGAAVLLTAAALFAVVRLRALPRFVLPDWAAWKTAVFAAFAFVAGAGLDLTYNMFDPTNRLIGALPLRMLCMAGSGLFFAALALTLLKAGLTLHRAEGKATGAFPWTQFLLVALVLNAVAALYIANSAAVYTWDNAGYWTVAGTLAREPLGLLQLRRVVQTTLTHDYNYLLAYPVSLLMRVFGTNRYVFVFSALNLYLLPGVGGLLVLGRRLRGGRLLPLLFLPMLFYLTLIGYVDVAAASLGIWAFVLYTDPDRPPVPTGLLVGALLTGTFLLRRYFFFFAVSFGVGALCMAAVQRGRDWKKFLALFASAAVTAVFAAQQFLLEKILAANYGSIYSAYQQGLRVDLLTFGRYFGAIILLILAVTGVYLLTRRGARGVAALALVQMAACFFALSRVQSHGAQHLLLYAPAAAALLAAGLAALPDRAPARACAAALAIATALSPVLPREQPAAATEIKYMAPLPSFTYAAPRRGDIGQLIALHAYVDNLSADGQKTAAVVASSFVFNSETYTNLYPSLGIEPGAGPSTPIVYMTGVDKRDAFSWHVLDADYLIVGDPVQTHLGEENQQVMALLARDVLAGTGPGAAYAPLAATFTLDGDVTVRLYRRTRAVSEAERRSISARLTAFYPDFADLYRYD